MGWYVTCRYCGQEGKYGYVCDCLAIHSEKLQKKMIGNELLTATLCNGEIEDYMLYVLYNKKTKKRFRVFQRLAIHMYDTPDEDGYFRKITKKEYYEYFNVRKYKRIHINQCIKQIEQDAFRLGNIVLFISNDKLEVDYIGHRIDIYNNP